MLLDHDEERARRVSEQGLIVTGVSGDYKVHVPTIVGPTPFSPDFVLICVKSNNTKEVGNSASPFAGPGTKLVTLQNGLGNIEILREIFCPSKVLRGVTAQGAT